MTLFKITNEPMRYAWGSIDLIPDLLGTEPDGQPIAEVWFGTHKNSPSQILDSVGGSLLERVGELPFLVKFLAAQRPLSIQAHPTKSRAEYMFAQSHASYQDANHKPELIVALTEFRALCGFRPKEELEADLEALATATIHLAGLWGAYEGAGLQGAMNWIYDSEDRAVGQLVANAPVLGRKRARLIEELFELYPGDKGILVSVLMNLVSLEPGEAMFLPAGNIHAYLFGLGVEVMANSDNVLRGGLTPKPIDVRELLKVLDYSELAEPRIRKKKILNGLWQFPVAVSDFTVYEVEASATNMLIDLELKGNAILACVSGELTISTSKDETLTLKRGEVCFLAEARLFSVSGSGTGYLTMG
jgi:mannose-6-phosphate isomerase